MKHTRNGKRKRHFLVSAADLAREEREISDASKLLWQSYHGPMATAAAQFNAAIANTQSLIAGIILSAEGADAKTMAFDMDRLMVVRRPEGR